MKDILYSAIALLAAAGHVVASSAPPLRAGNFTLTLCPHGNRGQFCFPQQEPSVVYPAKGHGPPGYAGRLSDFVVQWESEYLLTWEKEDDEPRNLTFAVGNYLLTKEIRSERSLNFTLEELAPTFSKRGPSNKTVTESDVFASGSETFLNSIKFTVWDPEQKGSVGNGIGSFRPMKLETWNFLYDTVKRQTSSTRDELNKKWRIGVGVGVGVGVPLLMLGSFFLGKRQARKHERPNSPFK